CERSEAISVCIFSATNEIPSVATLPRNDETVVGLLGGSKGAKIRATETISLAVLKAPRQIASLGLVALGLAALGPAVLRSQ
ncbi:MAG: hypothetical protein C4532_04660, partial [Candidatus Abyssobacteria bacterium SURF_17]